MSVAWQFIARVMCEITNRPLRNGVKGIDFSDILSSMLGL
jgi:hypothetical protein